MPEIACYENLVFDFVSFDLVERGHDLKSDYGSTLLFAIGS